MITSDFILLHVQGRILFLGQPTQDAGNLLRIPKNVKCNDVRVMTPHKMIRDNARYAMPEGSYSAVARNSTWHLEVTGSISCQCTRSIISPCLINLPVCLRVG